MPNRCVVPHAGDVDRKGLGKTVMQLEWASSPTRGTWIERSCGSPFCGQALVVPHAGDVDRKLPEKPA